MNIDLKKEKVRKQDVVELDRKLYNFNSQIVSLKWIGLGKKPADEEIMALNALLGETIHMLRVIRGKDD